MSGEIVGVLIVWDGDAERLEWHEVIGVGFPDEFSFEHDESIFYYVRDIAELAALREPENGSGWSIVEVEE